MGSNGAIMIPVMVKRWRQSGFTLIEVTLTLAISGLLILIAIVGQVQLRRRAQFSDAVERVKSNLNITRSEANTTVNCRTGAVCKVNNGTDPTREILGRELIFDPTKNYIQVYSLLRPTSGLSYVATDSRQMPYAWGLQFQNSIIGGVAAANPAVLVFWRQPSDGRLIASAMSCSDAACTTNPALSLASYPGVSGSLVLNFIDPNNFTAREIVELPGGSITRTIP